MGPLGLYKPSSHQDVLDLYGGYRWEAKTLSASSTGFTLAEPALGNIVEVYQLQGNKYVPIQLWNFSCSGNQVTFGRPGYVMDRKKVYLKYRRIPNDRDLIRAYEAVVPVEGAEVYLYRIDGEYASCKLGDCEFQAVYPSSWFNGVTLTIDSTGLTINEVPGLYSEITVPASDYATLRSSMGRLNALGISPVILVSAPLSGSIPAGAVSAALSGGADGNGEITPALLEELCSEFSVVVFPGVTAAQLASSISNNDLYLLESSSPALIVLDAPVPTDPVSGWLNDLCSDTSLRSKLVLTAAGTGVYNSGTSYEYYGRLAANLGAVLSLWKNPTAKKLGFRTIGPLLSSDELIHAAFSGINVPTVTIMRPSCWWYGVVRDTSWRLEDVCAYIEIVRLVRSKFEPLIGRPNISPQVTEDLMSIFEECVESTVLDASMRYENDVVTVEVECQPIGTVRTVRFSIAVKPPASFGG